MMPRSRTSLAAFVALDLLSIGRWQQAGDSWQTGVLQPRCVIIDPEGRSALVIACQVYAARIWKLHKDGDLMLLDPSQAMEWVVATDILLWKVVPWEPVVAFDRTSEQACYGCVSFQQIRQEVSALAWAVANHRLHKHQLKRFTKVCGAQNVEEMLVKLLAGHTDQDFYMNLFRRGKVAEEPSAELAEMTKACLGELDPDNLSAFKREKDKLMGDQLGDDLALGSDDEEPAVQQVDGTLDAGHEELDAAASGPEDHDGDTQLVEQLDGEEGLGLPALAPEASGEGRQAHIGRARPGICLDTEWARSWIPPHPPACIKFGITRIG